MTKRDKRYHHKGFTVNDIPKEVLEVWYIEMACAKTGVGRELYEKCKAVAEKYPEWFPITQH